MVVVGFPGMRRLVLLAALSAVALAACGGGDDAPAPVGTAPTASGFELTGGGIEEGEEIEEQYTCDGDDVSPALTWEGAPEGTRELALIVEDPDAEGFTHWLVYGMPPGVTSVPRGVRRDGEVIGPTPLRQGTNGFGRVGWGGPCPPEDETHEYVFRLLALDAELELPPGADREAFDAAVQGHVLAEARMSAPYGRP